MITKAKSIKNMECHINVLFSFITQINIKCVSIHFSKMKIKSSVRGGI